MEEGVGFSGSMPVCLVSEIVLLSDTLTEFLSYPPQLFGISRSEHGSSLYFHAGNVSVIQCMSL
jgi:hypothetical protein